MTEMDEANAYPRCKTFLKAAMTGEVTYPSIQNEGTKSTASMAGNEPGTSGCSKKKQTKRLRYTSNERASSVKYCLSTISVLISVLSLLEQA